MWDKYKSLFQLVVLIVVTLFSAMSYFVPQHSFADFKQDVTEWKLQDQKRQLRAEKNSFYREAQVRSLTPDEVLELKEIEEDYQDVKDRLKSLNEGLN